MATATPRTKKELKQYYQQVAEQGNALWRGIALTRDDCLRRDVIKALICNFQLDIAAVEAQWDVDFASYFAEDLKLLAPLAHDGLVAVDDKVIQVTAKGRLLIRNICMCFDAYLRQRPECSSSHGLFNIFPSPAGEGNN